MNMIPIKQSGNNNLNGEENDLEVVDQVDNEVKNNPGDQIEDKINLISLNGVATDLNDDEFYYEPFKLSPTTRNNNTWPFEVDFEKPKQVIAKKQNNNQSLSKSKSGKCLTCKKLPVSKTEDQLASTSNSTNPINKTNNFNNLAAMSQSKTGVQQQSSQNMRQKISPNIPFRMSDSDKPAPFTASLTTTLLNPTYNSVRRCISAKQQPVISQTDAKPALNNRQSSAKMSRSYVIDVVDFNRNNYNDEFDIDKEIVDEDDIDFLKNVEMNKEEQLRKMNILPGKNFRSQRRKSISIDHVPVSKKKIETQKTRILLTTQKCQLQEQQAQTLNKQCLSYQLKQDQVKSLSSKSSGNLEMKFTKKNQMLAVQHHEEIYSLINKKTNDLNNSSNKSCLFDYSNEEKKHRNLIKNEDLATIVYKKANKLSVKNFTNVNLSNSKRPKTSKV